MARFIAATESVPMVGAVDGTSQGRSISWQDFVRALFIDQRLSEEMDALARMDLFHKLRGLEPGAYAELSESDYCVLERVARRPKTLSADFYASPGADAFLRAILDAPKEAPKP